MQDDIFRLLMMILMLENGGGTENINQLILMFLLMQSQSGLSGAGSSSCPSRRCGQNDGYTF